MWNPASEYIYLLKYSGIYINKGENVRQLPDFF